MGKCFTDEEYKKLIIGDEKNFEAMLKKILEKRNERIKIIGENQVMELEKVVLQSIDVNWKLHIQYLEQLRQVIGLRSYGQRDPLIEYKKKHLCYLKTYY